MPKPKKERRVQLPPPASFYKPQGIPLSQLQQVILNVEEYEAIRLVDHVGMDQENAAVKLGISRPTCARIVEAAHKKVAEALAHGKALRIEGGSYSIAKNLMRCRACGHAWEVANAVADAGADAEHQTQCPDCGSSKTIDLGGAVANPRHGRRAGGRHHGGGRGFLQ